MNRGTPQYLLFYKNQYKGPYDESLVLEELSQKRLGRDALVWSEEAGRWSAVEEIFAFSEYTNFLGPDTKLSEDLDEKQEALQKVSRESAVHRTSDDEIQSDPYEKLRLRRISSARPLSLETIERISENMEVSQGEIGRAEAQPRTRRSSGFYAVWALVGLVVGTVAVLQVAKFSDQNIEAILGRIKGNYQEITLAKEFLRGRRDLKPFVLPEITGEGELPRFRIFAALPDSSQVLLHFKGLRKTLVGSIHEEAFVDVIINGKTGGTPPVQGKSRKELSPGFYKVTMTCLNCNGSGLLPQVVSKPVPVGIGDQGRYQENLKAFHGLLKDQAESEIIEIKEMLTVLAGLLDKKSAGAGADKIFAQVAGLLESIDTNVAQSDYVFGQVYLDVKALATTIRNQDWRAATQRYSRLKKQVPALERSVRKSNFMDALGPI